MYLYLDLLYFKEYFSHIITRYYKVIIYREHTIYNKNYGFGFYDIFYYYTSTILYEYKSIIHTTLVTYNSCYIYQ